MGKNDNFYEVLTDKNGKKYIVKNGKKFEVNLYFR